MNSQQMKTEYMSEKTKAFMKKHNRNLKIENAIKTCLIMLIPVSLVILIILDWLRVFRLSWLF